ncbi:MAG: FAD-binding oxidoreductase [Desulfurococcales archaeon]|nr:FAD-binding oxidoreductase [Desulfurococcales archaeon]
MNELKEVVSRARNHTVCLLPRGGGSGVLGALAPRDCCVYVDLSRFDWIEPHVEEGYVYVGAGALLSRVEEVLGGKGYTTGLEPQSIRVASVGGLVNTLGAGALQPGIGNIEDILIYVDMVDGGSRRLRLGDPRRPRAYGLAGGPFLIAGSEGSLGIVYGVGLRIRRIPRYTSSGTFEFNSIEDALLVARRLLQWNQPALLRVLDEYEASTLYGGSGTLLLVAYYDNEDPRVPQALLGKASKIAGAQGGRSTQDIYEKWRETRYDYHKLVEQVAGIGLWFDTIDVQATWPRLPRIHKAVTEKLQATKGVVGVFSHISHFNTMGGSLYTTIIVERDPQVLANAWRVMLDTVLEIGGSVTHHHGVGLQKLYWILRERPWEIEAYCRVKRAFDPEGILQAHGLASACRRS